MIRLKLGEDVDQRHPPSYDTALHGAAECGHTELVQLLLQRGASTNLANAGDETPLAVAKRWVKTAIKF